MQDIGQWLPVLAEHLIADIGKPNHADERRVKVLLVVYRRVADPRGVVGNGHEVRRRVRIRPQHAGCDVEVVAQRRKTRLHLGQIRIEVAEHLAELLATAAERRPDGAKGLIQLGGLDR